MLDREACGFLLGFLLGTALCDSHHRATHAQLDVKELAVGRSHLGGDHVLG